MTPILLDQTGIFRAGMAVSVTMLVVFFSGYYIGQQKADPGQGMELNKTIALALPGPAHADTTEYEAHIPRVQMPGAYIDVDSPDESTLAGSMQQAVTHTHRAGPLRNTFRPGNRWTAIPAPHGSPTRSWACTSTGG